MTAYNPNMNLPVVQIADTQVQQIAYKGEPVVSFAMVDEIHQRADGTASRNFRDNRERFVEGVDFIELTADEIRRQSLHDIFPPRTPKGILLTERGYLKLVKPMQDDRAWEVQGEMIDCYFKVKDTERLATPVAASTALSREVRLQAKALSKLAKEMGLEGNQAVLSVCRGVENLTGINPMTAMGITHIQSAQNDDMLNVKNLGARIGVTAQEMNLKLIGRGLQTSYRDQKGNLRYELTEEGRAHGGAWHDAQKAQGGRPIRQLLWPSRVADLFCGDQNEVMA